MQLPSTKVLVIDTETTGLPTSEDELSPNQPWPIQIGAVYFDLAGDRFDYTLNTLVKPPEGTFFNPKAVAVHGITEEMVAANGRDMRSVLHELRDLASHADVIASYNWAFDHKIVEMAGRRTHKTFADYPVLGVHGSGVNHACVMNLATATFGSRQKLSFVYRKIKGVQLEGAHDALADAVAAAIVFKELIVRTMATPLDH